MIVEIYTVNTSTGAFSKVKEITTFKDLGWARELNGVGSARFSLDVWDA